MKPARILSLLALAAVLAAFPLVVTNAYYIHLVQMIAIYAVLLLGLDIVVGYTGEVSLGHAALFGVGSYTTGVLVMHLSWPLWATLPASIAVTAVFGAVLALPALRVTGPYLAMVTLAFGTIVQIFINEMDFLTNGPMGISLSKPSLFGTRLGTLGFYEFTLACAALTVLVVHRIVGSHLGRAFEALRDSPLASDCMAVSVYRNKVIAFVVSAALAGFAGGLFTYSEEYISPNTYSIELAILFLLAAIMGGRKSRSGPILGAAIIVILPNVLADLALVRMLAVAGAVASVLAGLWFVLRRRAAPVRSLAPAATFLGLCVLVFQIEDMTDYRLTVFGLLILLVVFYLPDGVVGFVQGRWAALQALRAARAGDRTAAAAAAGSGSQGGVESGAGAVAGAATVPAAVFAAPAAPAGVPDGAPLLRLSEVLMQFGGLTALNRVSLEVARGSVHGIIGPNGSGKSTMMNVLTGIYRPTGGGIEFLGQQIAGRSPAQIAAAGIGRTFQNVQLFSGMSVIENVLVAMHKGFRATLAEVIVHAPRYLREQAAARRRAQGILDFVGLGALATEQARNLPYGKQRLLEIGRALALDPQVLLLDEPAAGLTAPDIVELVAIIRRIREAGITVILIEHHMDVVTQLCDRVSVLDFGVRISEGTPGQVQSDPKVVEAYLGAGLGEVGGGDAPEVSHA